MYMWSATYHTHSQPSEECDLAQAPVERCELPQVFLIILGAPYQENDYALDNLQHMRFC